MDFWTLGYLGAFIIWLASLDWKLSVKVALVIAVLEGALRKWVLPQASQMIYFLKDFALLGAYIGFYTSPRTKLKLVAKSGFIKGIAWLAALWCLFQVFNPSLGSPIIGIVGFKNYFIYVPLLWITPSLFETEEKFVDFLRKFLLLLIPIGILAIVQFFSPVDSPINVYAPGGPAENMGIAVGGDLKSVRVTGTFSYLAGYSVYLGFCLSLILPFLTLPKNQKWQLLLIAEALLIAITTFMTGARGLLITSLIVIGGYFLLQGLTKFSNFISSLSRFLPFALLSFWLVTTQFSSAIDALFLRFSTNSDMPGRIYGLFLEPFQNFTYKGLDGYGAGATFQANPVIRNIFWLPPGEQIPTFYESEPGRIALELGPIGFFIWYIFKILLVLALLKTFFSLKRPFLKQLALSTFLIQATLLTGQIVFNQTAGIFHWFLNSFIFLLPQLEHFENWRQNQYYQQHIQQHGHSSSLSSPPHQ